MSRRLAFAYPIATTSLSIGVENVSRHTDDSHIAVGARFASNTTANSTANAMANATAHAAANATAPKNQTTKSGPSDDENTWDNHSSMFCFPVACQILSSHFLKQLSTATLPPWQPMQHRFSRLERWQAS